MYNCQNTIKNTIHSIQNQNLIEIEIILINDFSKDNTLKFTKNLNVEDSRIKIINIYFHWIMMICFCQKIYSIWHIKKLNLMKLILLHLKE